jgi:hypothetical protein
MTLTMEPSKPKSTGQDPAAKVEDICFRSGTINASYLFELLVDERDGFPVDGSSGNDI